MAASNALRSAAMVVETKPKFYVESDESYSGSGGGGSMHGNSPAANGPSNSTFVGNDREMRDASENNGSNTDPCSSLTPKDLVKAPGLPTQSPITPFACTSRPNNCMKSVPIHHQSMSALNSACGSGSSHSQPSSGNLVHSVLRRSRDGQKGGLIYWDHINEILDTTKWLRLEKMAVDTRSNADVLLSDNRCLSMSCQALSELMTIFGLLVLDERRTNFLVVMEPVAAVKFTNEPTTGVTATLVSKQKCAATASSSTHQHHPSATQQGDEEAKQMKPSKVTNDPDSDLIDQPVAGDDLQLVDETRIVMDDKNIPSSEAETREELTIDRKRQIISQLLLVYDLLQKVQQAKIFNGSRFPIQCSQPSMASSFPTSSFAISAAVDTDADMPSSSIYHNGLEPTSSGGITISRGTNILGAAATFSSNSAAVASTSASGAASALPTPRSNAQRTVAHTYIKSCHNQQQNSGSTNDFVDPSSDIFPSIATSLPLQHQEPNSFACPCINVQCLRNLEALSLDNVPLEAIKGLQSHRARQLQCLTLRRAGISKIYDIAVRCGADKASEHSWQYLMEADFSHNPLKSLDSSLRLFTNLNALQLTHCDLSSAHGLANLTAPLQHLDLSHNNLTTLPILNAACHETLLSLRLVFNSICSIMGMQQLVAIQHLELQDNLLSLVGSLAPLGALSELRTLWILGNPVCTLKNSRAHIISRLHCKLARNKFCLDEVRLSDYDLTKLSTRNWVLGRSNAVDLNLHEHADQDNNVTTTLEFAQFTSANVMTPEALLRAQQAADLGSRAAERLMPVVRPVVEEAEEATAKTKKKRSSSKRTRIVVIAEPEGDDYRQPEDTVEDGTSEGDTLDAASSNAGGGPHPRIPPPGPVLNVTHSRTSSIVHETAKPARPWYRGASMQNLRESGGVLPHEILIEDLLLSAIAPPPPTRTGHSATTSHHHAGDGGEGNGSGVGPSCAGGGNRGAGSCGVVTRKSVSGAKRSSASGGGCSGTATNNRDGAVNKACKSGKDRPSENNSEPSEAGEIRGVRDLLTINLDDGGSETLEWKSKRMERSSVLLNQQNGEQNFHLTVQHTERESLDVENLLHLSVHATNVSRNIAQDEASLRRSCDELVRVSEEDAVLKHKQNSVLSASTEDTASDIENGCAASAIIGDKVAPNNVDELSVCDNSCDTIMATTKSSTASDCSVSAISDVDVSCSSGDSSYSSCEEGSQMSENFACLSLTTAGKKNELQCLGNTSQTNNTSDDLSRKNDTLSSSACVGGETDHTSCGAISTVEYDDNDTNTTATSPPSEGSNNSDIAIICEVGDGDSYFGDIDNFVDYTGACDGHFDREVISVTYSSSESRPKIEQISEHECHQDETAPIVVSASKSQPNSSDLGYNSYFFSNSSWHRAQKPVDGIPIPADVRIYTELVITEGAPYFGGNATPVQVHCCIPVRTGVVAVEPDVEADEIAVEALEECAEATAADLEFTGADVEATGSGVETTRDSEASEVCNLTTASMETSSRGGYDGDGDGHSLWTSFGSPLSFFEPKSLGASSFLTQSINALSSRIIAEGDESYEDNLAAGLEPNGNRSSLAPEEEHANGNTQARVSKEKKIMRSKSQPLCQPVVYPCQVEGYHTPKLLFVDPEYDLKHLERYEATLTILGRVLTQQKRGQTFPLKVPFTRILCVQCVSQQPFRVRILYNDHLLNGNSNHVTYRLSPEHGKELLLHIDSLMPDGKVDLELTPDAVTCGHCGNVFNRCLALAYKGEPNAMCPDCGWTLNNKRTKKKHITYDMDLLHYLSNPKYTSYVLPSIKDLRKNPKRKACSSSDISSDNTTASNNRELGLNDTMEPSGKMLAESQSPIPTFIPRIGSSTAPTQSLEYSTSLSLVAESNMLLTDLNIVAAPAATVCKTVYDVISNKQNLPKPGFPERAVDKQRGLGATSFGTSPSPSNPGSALLHGTSVPAFGQTRSYGFLRSKAANEQLMDLIRHKMMSKSVSPIVADGFRGGCRAGASHENVSKLMKRRVSKHSLRRPDAVDHDASIKEPSAQIGQCASSAAAPIKIPSSSSVEKGVSIASSSACNSVGVVSSYKSSSVPTSHSIHGNQSFSRRSPGGRKPTVLSPRKLTVSHGVRKSPGGRKSTVLATRKITGSPGVNGSPGGRKSTAVSTCKSTVRPDAGVIFSGSPKPGARGTSGSHNQTAVKVSSSSRHSSNSNVPPKANLSGRRKANKAMAASALRVEDTLIPTKLNVFTSTSKGSTRDSSSSRVILKDDSKDAEGGLSTVESLLKRNTQLASSRSLPGNQQSYQR